MDSCTFVPMEAELNPGSMEEWLSTVKDGKKCEKGKRSDLSIKVKKHLSALGWVFSYFYKGKKRELRYKSPKGRWFYSLAQACMSCVNNEGSQQQQQTVPKNDLSCSPINLSSESWVDVLNQEQMQEKKRCRVEDVDINSTAPEKENHLSEDLIKIVPNVDESEQQQKKEVKNGVEDYDMANVDQENIRIVQDSQQQQQQTVPKNDLNCSPVNLSPESSFDVPNQEQMQEKLRCRLENVDINSTAPEKKNHLSEDLIKIVPNVDESNQEQKNATMNRMEDCDTAAVNVDQEKISIVLDVDVLNHQQKKRRKMESEEIRRQRVEKSPEKILQVMEKMESEEIRRQRIEKSPEKILQVMEKMESEEIRRQRIEKSPAKILQVTKKNQQKNKREKKPIRFCRKDCGPDKNCDVCCLCHWGGELLLCHGCPSAFHHTCLGLLSLPEEDLWFCPCCCCDICGSMDSPENSMLMVCEQCHGRFHLECLKEEHCMVSCRGWFCSSQCNRVSSALQNLLGCKIAVGDDGDLVWTLMRATNKVEHYDDDQISKLESAVEILHQGFKPTNDRFSGRDLVEELLFTRDRNGVARGAYTVLIERMNEPVTVAALRVDKHVAEIPLLASLPNYRRIGMCRVLMDELEKQMSQMGVCRLVLPAAEEAVTTWTQRFGFSVMETSERVELVKHGMFDFIGTVMCHKFLLKEREEDYSAEESSLTQ